MSDDEHLARRVGAQMAATLGALERRPDRSMDALRTRLVSAPPRRTAREGARRMGAVAAAFALVVASAMAAWRISGRTARVTLLGSGGRPVPIALDASPDRPLVAQFSDGTTVRIQAASKARVTALDEDGATIALEDGTLHADVRHRPETRWRVVAGPYAVRVVGTEFDVGWNPEAEEITVTVERGRVVLEAPQSSREVAAGMTVTASVLGEGAAARDAGAAAPSAQAAAPAEAAPAESESKSFRVTAPATGESASVPRRAPTAAPRWRVLAGEGRFDEALAAFSAPGHPPSLDAIGAADLLTLGDTARLAHQPDQAEQAYLALRRRFPNDPRRTQAAFSLGRMAAEQRGNAREAASWFRTYLREAPSGPLAADAAARWLESAQALGDPEGTRDAAQAYLVRDPHGPYAERARSVVSGSR